MSNNNTGKEGTADAASRLKASDTSIGNEESTSKLYHIHQDECSPCATSRRAYTPQHQINSPTDTGLNETTNGNEGQEAKPLPLYADYLNRARALAESPERNNPSARSSPVEAAVPRYLPAPCGQAKQCHHPDSAEKENEGSQSHHAGQGNCCSHTHIQSHHHHRDEMTRNQERNSPCSHAHNDGGPRSPASSVLQSYAIAQDIENGPAMEHVVLTVYGMTCSGCGGNLARALGSSNGVCDVRVNFAINKAHMKVDVSKTSVEDVIRSAERTTGFRCMRQGGDDQTIDLVAQPTAINILLEARIDGLLNAQVLDKRSIRVAYDPLIIGARSLLDRIGDISHGLAPPGEDPSVSIGRQRFHHQVVATALAALFAIPVAILTFANTGVDTRTASIVCFVLATLVQLIAIQAFYTPAMSALLLNRTIEMDMLVVISITAAYLYSATAFGLRMARKDSDMKELFETSTLLITFVLLGRVLVGFARDRAIRHVSMRSLQNSKAIIVEAGEDREIDSRLLQFGDIFKVPPHSRVPTDGIIIEGTSEVDESMITGESMPAVKGPNADAVAGTMNGSRPLTIQLTRLPGRNTITDIARLVEDACEVKPRIQDLADRVAGLFVYVVLAIGGSVFVIWCIVGFAVRHQSTKQTFLTAITHSVAVLAVSCPCALGLAVPMVLVVAEGIAAKKGVIIKSGDLTERLRKITDVVFDKTGTLTEDSLAIVRHVVVAPEALAIAQGLVQGNKHPVSVAVKKYLSERRIEEAGLESIDVVPGSGVYAALPDGGVVKAGNPTWTATYQHPAVASALREELTVLSITRNDELIAMFALKVRIRPEAASIVKQLDQRGVVVHLVSGDQPRAVYRLATQVGIPAAKTNASCSPHDKKAYVSRLMDQGRAVLFCGDGTNDAVAVAQADVGVQLSSTTSSCDVTQNAADVVLLAGLNGILDLFDVSQSAFRRMVFNFFWAGIYNITAILMTSGVLVRIEISPTYAGLGELISVLPVILVGASMHLSRWTRSRK